MKTSELIDQLQLMIDKFGDCSLETTHCENVDRVYIKKIIDEEVFVIKLLRRGELV